MFCEKCGAQIPDDAVFCPKCGYKVGQSQGNGAGSPSQAQTAQVIAPPDVQELKCPSCGAPLKPQFGEMVITCEYCGASVCLNTNGWKNIEKNSMLALKIPDQDSLIKVLKGYMDRGLLRRHLEEESKLEQVSLAYIPYWVVTVSARTQYTAVSEASTIGTVAGSVALMSLMGGAMGGRRGMGMGMMDGALMGGMVGGGMGMGGGNLRAYTYDQNYNYPVVAVKGLLEYQPKDFSFNLAERTPFDISKVPKGIKVLNGEIGEDAAKYEAKTYVDQLQSQKVHEQHHMVQKIVTQDDVSDPELIHAPVWFAKFSYKSKEISIVVDGNSGKVINSIGLNEDKKL
jgi:DNA-directed RNA polymerase subunit RPC12/RpoP